MSTPTNSKEGVLLDTRLKHNGPNPQLGRPTRVTNTWTVDEEVALPPPSPDPTRRALPAGFSHEVPPRIDPEDPSKERPR